MFPLSFRLNLLTMGQRSREVMDMRNSAYQPSNRSAGSKRGPAPSTAPEPAKEAKATMPPGDVLVPVGPSGSSVRSGKILTMDHVFERYSEEDVVRIVRWYEGIRATIPDAKRQDA